MWTSRGRFVGCVEVAIEHVRSAADGSVVRYRRFVAIDDLIRRAPLVRASGRGVEQLDGRNRELVDEVLRETCGDSKGASTRHDRFASRLLETFGLIDVRWGAFDLHTNISERSHIPLVPPRLLSDRTTSTTYL